MAQRPRPAKTADQGERVCVGLRRSNPAQPKGKHPEGPKFTLPSLVATKSSRTAELAAAQADDVSRTLEPLVLPRPVRPVRPVRSSPVLPVSLLLHIDAVTRTPGLHLLPSRLRQASMRRKNRAGSAQQPSGPPAVQRPPTKPAVKLSVMINEPHQGLSDGVSGRGAANQGCDKGGEQAQGFAERLATRARLGCRSAMTWRSAANKICSILRPTAI